MGDFEINGLGQLDETTTLLERTLEDRQENVESVSEGYLLRALTEIVAELRDASTNIRQETQEAMRLAEEKYRGSVDQRRIQRQQVRALLNRQEVLEEKAERGPPPDVRAVFCVWREEVAVRELGRFNRRR